MGKTFGIALLAAVALAGCNDQQAATNQPKIKITGPEQQKLHQLDALNLAIALKRAIYDAGYNCKRVTRSGFVGAYKNLDMWMASCADGRDWAIFAGPDGSAQVRDCKDVTGLGLPQCASKEEPGQGSAEAG